MIKYFSIKKRTRDEKNTSNNYKRKRCAELYFREKSSKFAKKEKATYISKSKNILIVGEVASGKSKELLKLYKAKEIIYNTLNKNNRFIYFDCNISISEILEIHETTLQKENKTLSTKELQDKLNHIDEDEDEDDLTQKQIKSLYARINKLEEYSYQAIIFIDDINKATGKKLEVLKKLIRNSKVWIITTKNDYTINKNLSKNMNLRNKDSYYKFNLISTQAVDATNVLFLIFIIFLIILGQTDMAILLMAGRFMLKQGTAK
jgi:hypothetical protein